MAPKGSISSTDHASGDSVAIKNHFDVLDGQRGVAAFLVLLSHASGMAFGPGKGCIDRVHLAVLFFFMLSGMVIASAYQKRIIDGMSFGSFMLRRAVRLYPLIVMGVTLGTIWFATFDPKFQVDLRSVSAILANILAMPAAKTPFSFGGFPLNPPVWSLFFELVAYASYVTVIAKLRIKYLGILTLAGTCAFMAFSWHFPGGSPMQYQIFMVGGPFCIGVIIWRLRADKLARRIKLPSYVFTAALVGMCIFPKAATVLVDYAAVLLVFPAIIIFGMARGTGAASSFERLLGDLSFPIYILHWPICLAANYFVGASLGPMAGIAAGVVGSIVLSWIALRFYDEPLRAFLTRRLSARPMPFVKQTSFGGLVSAAAAVKAN